MRRWPQACRQSEGARCEHSRASRIRTSAIAVRAMVTKPPKLGRPRSTFSCARLAGGWILRYRPRARTQGGPPRGIQVAGHFYQHGTPPKFLEKFTTRRKRARPLTYGNTMSDPRAVQLVPT